MDPEKQPLQPDTVILLPSRSRSRSPSRTPPLRYSSPRRSLSRSRSRSYSPIRPRVAPAICGYPIPPVVQPPFLPPGPNASRHVLHPPNRSSSPSSPLLLVFCYKSARILAKVDRECSYEDVLRSARSVFPKLPANDRNIFLETDVQLSDGIEDGKTVRARITPETWSEVRPHGSSRAEIEIRTRSRWTSFVGAFKGST
ncbi:unnamed protein product [Peniophora sp. CBMAI 1063]|nr:unnamed protein product [Peniophora sp. CBMAI 1063]